jgi:hypothetical protein
MSLRIAEKLNIKDVIKIDDDGIEYVEFDILDIDDNILETAKADPNETENDILNRTGINFGISAWLKID